MFRQFNKPQFISTPEAKFRPLVWVAILCLGGCSTFFHPGRVAGSGDSGKVDDAALKQTVDEWREAKPNIEKLAKLEGDLNFLLNEVSKMSEIGQVPGMPIAGGPNSVAGGPNSVKVPSISEETLTIDANGQVVARNNNAPAGDSSYTNTGTINSTEANTGAMAYGGNNGGVVNFANFQCPQPFNNGYQKNLAFFSFPRVKTDSSKVGALYKVEQHLPMLIGANLYNRHGIPAPLQLGNSFASAGERGELDTADQLQTLARQHRAQYFVTGDVDDMSLTYTDSVVDPGLYTRFVSGVHDLFHFNSRLDKRSRVFSFTLEVRDSITGQIVFAKRYKTFGKWNTSADAKEGFASPEFWKTDYGHQVQYLVGKASDELASSLQCQPFMARVDSRMSQDMVVIHSGASNGLQVGDAMELYQLVYEPVTGQYQRYETRLIKKRGKVYLTEVYPGHSVGHVVDEPLLNGQYVVRAL